MADQRHGLPSHIFTGDIESARGESRLQVDQGRTGFWLNHEYRISYPITIAGVAEVWIKFSASLDFILQFQDLTCYAEGLKLESYRASQGIEVGEFAIDIPFYRNNGLSTAPDHTVGVAVTTGATFTPTGGEVPTETIPVLAGSSTNRMATVGQGMQGERGLPAGDYYLKLTNLNGAGTALGVYSLIWEERPETIT